METPSIHEIVRTNEDDFIRGNTLISKYVRFSLHETIERITAYVYSKHISGETDSLGRDKPFFNIVTAAVNIWFRATDIDRKDIKIHATKAADWIDSFLATIHLHDWMRKERFGHFLNTWGRTLARYGSAVVKCVENSQGLHISVIPWNRIICDSIDFKNNPKIEVLELTQAQLYARIDTNGYSATAVKELCDAVTARQTLDRQRKDNKTGYIKLYEVHGKLSKALLTGKDKDEHVYVQQMQVISYVNSGKGRKTEYQDFTLYKGQEKSDPYRITHLIEESDRTLAIGAVEYLFEAQWMENHSKKSVKDTLDIASKLVFQTADASLLGRNVLTDLQDGEILIHAIGDQMALSKVDNSKPDLSQWGNYATEWKSLGNEITGISEAMLGAVPKSGTAWHQTEAILQESYSLFELMTENKGLYLEDMLREWILPWVKKGLNSSKEISATLSAYDIDRIDSIYIKNKSIREVNKKLAKSLIEGKIPTPDEQTAMLADAQSSMQQSLAQTGNQRFFKPSDISDKTWKEQFKDLEWEVAIDITGEAYDTNAMLTTLTTALKLVVTPGFEQNKRAQGIVGRILELTGAMSPVEYNALAVPQQAQPVAAPDIPIPAPAGTPPVAGG